MSGAGMLPRDKKEHEWEELPPGSNDRSRDKPKSGSLREVGIFVPLTCTSVTLHCALLGKS